MRLLFNSALVVWLLCASLAAQTTQTPSPKSGKIPVQKPGAKREITPQQEQAISAINKLFERTKEFADDKTRIDAQAQIADALWQYDQKTARRQFTTEPKRAADLIQKGFKGKLKKPAISSRRSQLRKSFMIKVGVRMSHPFVTARQSTQAIKGISTPHTDTPKRFPILSIKREFFAGLR